MVKHDAKSSYRESCGPLASRLNRRRRLTQLRRWRPIKERPRTPMQRKRGNNCPIDLAALLDPARAFAHPADVVSDPDLTLTEKRAILAGWARRACAAEAMPDLPRPADDSAGDYDAN